MARQSRTLSERQLWIRNFNIPADDPAEPVTLRLSLRHQQQLEYMRQKGGYRSRAALLQSLVETMLRDQARKD
jgi:hypothetical protein